MTIQIRNAKLDDASQMSELLNEIIAIGGTTAFLDPVSPELMQEWMTKDDGRATWLVAEDEDGLVVGYQSAEPRERLPADAASIASFVRVGVVGGGIGSKLFTQTCNSLRALGYTWINATIRSDNDSGLRYYTKMGFQDWHIEPDAALTDGRITGKTHKRFDL
ncbi:N-acetyltransferase family protein [Planktotalea sp.]|uniref:GNAT family N-acetyltransferase n=1 Tax=Planktotalea sp. TaxID=2029877 RepID=UPI003D6B0120